MYNSNTQHVACNMPWACGNALIRHIERTFIALFYVTGYISSASASAPPTLEVVVESLLFLFWQGTDDFEYSFALLPGKPLTETSNSWPQKPPSPLPSCCSSGAGNLHSGQKNLLPLELDIAIAGEISAVSSSCATRVISDGAVARDCWYCIVQIENKKVWIASCSPSSEEREKVKNADVGNTEVRAFFLLFMFWHWQRHQT